MNHLMGIDIATSGVKTIIITPTGKIVGEGFHSYTTQTPNPGWIEQNPADWWNAVVNSIKTALAQAAINPTDIKGIGLSGQMHGATFLDKSGSPLRPCMIWADTRTGPQCDFINKTFGQDKFIDLTCNPALSSFTVTNILWVKQNEPEVFAKTDKVLLPKDYIRYRLTDVFATEVSDASGTSMLDVRNRKWSKEVLETLDIPQSFMPDCYEAHEPTSKISAKVAAETGLAENTPVVGGAGDVAAGAVGAGAIEPGVVTIIMGSGGIVFAATDKVLMDQNNSMQSYCHAIPDKWFVMGCMLSCSFSLRYFKETFADLEEQTAKQSDTSVYKILDEKAALAPPGSEGLIFLPYLNGERTPHKDPYARGCFFGMTLRHNKSHYVRSVMEGVAYGLRDAIQILRDLKIEIKQVRAVGGGASSPLWRQILADIFNAEVVSINITEASALGVAILAGVGTGVYKDVKDGCDQTIKITSSTKPIEKNVKTYDGYYKIFRKLYPALKPHFKATADHVEKVHNM